MDWQEAKDVKKDIKELVRIIELDHIDLSRIHCYRTSGSKARAYARTWAFPKIFQKALKVEAAYVIEVLSHYYDRLSEEEKKKVLIHELLHIPQNFSGALLPHVTRSRHIGRLTNKLYKQYQNASR